MFYRKSDIITNISFSLLIILIQNPFSIMNVGLILSFVATIGIIMFYEKLNNFYVLPKEEKSRLKKFLCKIKEIVSVSIAAQILILPLSILFFNKISLTFLFSNIAVSFFIGIIIILGFVSIIFRFEILFCILNFLLETLKEVANYFAGISISKITVITPSLIFIILYYILIIGLIYMWTLRKKEVKRAFEKKILTYVDNFKCRIFKHKNKIIAGTLSLVIIFQVCNSVPKELRIYFIDVGQGDSTLIITPMNKTILIDGGGDERFDVGENTLLPYLLDRKIKTINYMMISHFDTDHVGGLFAILENIKVEKVIICKQGEDSENYQKFNKIVKEKRIKVIVVKKGDNIHVEKDINIKILWPEEKQIKENILNNNSIVAKLNYNEFSILLTGDIEKIAEEQILKAYKETNILKSSILKVAHHGSKTSTTDEFLKAVSPRIALIGVREK